MRCAYVCVSIDLQSWTLPLRLPSCNRYTVECVYETDDEKGQYEK